MIMREAMAIASDWVVSSVSKEPWFKGAYFSGSSIKHNPDHEVPANSDLDVMVVTTAEAPSLKLGKFLYLGVLLEVSYLPIDLFSSAQKVLSDYHVAFSFHATQIITDPEGLLKPLQKEVASKFNERQWVYNRCSHAIEKIEHGLKNIPRTAPFHEQVTSWLFPTGVTTHVFLSAALQNPTIRLRYVAVKKVLATYQMNGMYETLLQQLGCASIKADSVKLHLNQLSDTFDLTSKVSKTPFFFSTDITEATRPIAINGSQSLIKNRLHREAVFWIIATFARCHTILAVDAPDLHKERFVHFEAALHDIGILSSDDLYTRADETLSFIPELWESVQEVLEKNPFINQSS